MVCTPQVINKRYLTVSNVLMLLHIGISTIPIQIGRLFDVTAVTTSPNLKWTTGAKEQAFYSIDNIAYEAKIERRNIQGGFIDFSCPTAHVASTLDRATAQGEKAKRQRCGSASQI